MVYSVNQSVLDIVKTQWVVITPVVCVTKDAMMVGLDQSVQKVHVYNTLVSPIFIDVVELIHKIKRSLNCNF